MFFKKGVSLNNRSISPSSKSLQGSGQKIILVVEDNMDMQEVIYSVLRRDNYTVIPSSNGTEALQILARNRYPDLILLDFCMPGMSGKVFLEKLEEMDSKILGTVPVIFMTGMDVLPPTKAAGVIQKPFSSSTLLNRIQYHLNLDPRSF